MTRPVWVWVGMHVDLCVHDFWVCLHALVAPKKSFYSVGDFAFEV